MYFWTAYSRAFNIPGQIVKSKIQLAEGCDSQHVAHWWSRGTGKPNWQLSLLSLTQEWQEAFGAHLMFYCDPRINNLHFSPGLRLCSSNSIQFSEEGGGSVWCLRGLNVCVGGDFGLLWSDIHQEAQNSVQNSCCLCCPAKGELSGKFTAKFKGASIPNFLVWLSGHIHVEL